MPQQPSREQQQAWTPPTPSGQPASSRRPLLILLLLILLAGLGTLTFIYTPIGDNIKDILQASTGGADSGPEISNVGASAGQTHALITWTTNKPASSQVEYGRTKNQTKNEPTAPANDPSRDASLGVVSHSVTLRGLTPSSPAGNIKYYYRVISKDSDGNEQVSDWKTFETLRSET